MTYGVEVYFLDGRQLSPRADDNNSSNELTSISSTNYTFDNNGNTLTKVVGSSTTTYAWNFENRLASVTLPGSGVTVSFKYDPFGRRIVLAAIKSLETSLDMLNDCSATVQQVT